MRITAEAGQSPRQAVAGRLRHGRRSGRFPVWMAGSPVQEFARPWASSLIFLALFFVLGLRPEEGILERHSLIRFDWNAASGAPFRLPVRESFFRRLKPPMNLYSGTTCPFPIAAASSLREGMDFQVIDVDMFNAGVIWLSSTRHNRVPVLVERDLILRAEHHQRIYRRALSPSAAHACRPHHGPGPRSGRHGARNLCPYRAGIEKNLKLPTRPAREIRARLTETVRHLQQAEIAAGDESPCSTWPSRRCLLASRPLQHRCPQGRSAAHEYAERIISPARASSMSPTPPKRPCASKAMDLPSTKPYLLRAIWEW